MMKLSVIVQNVYLKIQPREIIESTDTDRNLIIIMKYKTIVTSSKDKINRYVCLRNKQLLNLIIIMKFKLLQSHQKFQIITIFD
jgi:hypothetical protein